MKFLFALVASLFCFIMFAQQPFVTTWEVTAGDLDILIPTSNQFTYNYTVDFGDGTVLSNQTDDVNHTYSTAGTYTVSISGVFPHLLGISFGSYSQKIMTIQQWGDIQWQSMSNSFRNCANLTINATDAPDLSNVTNMNFMFSYANSVNSPSISNWDVSNVTDMAGLFIDADGFNQPLNNWDVSNVTNMREMFSRAISFNQPLNNWDVSNVTNMTEMFRGKTIFYDDSNFNQPLNNWDVSNVITMNRMFQDADSFNQPLDNWDVSNVTGMSFMFDSSTYNQPLNNWDVSNVQYMGYMFRKCDEFNQPIDNWDVSNVVNMESMFYGADNFNQPLNNWDVSNVTDMERMFSSANNFNQPIDLWDVSNVTDMERMFAATSLFNQPLNNWDVSNVVNMESMFSGAHNFNQPLDSWDTSNAFIMKRLFRSADNFNQPLNNWVVSSVGNMKGMFKGAISFNQPLNDWDVSNVTDMENMFSSAHNFDQPLNNWNVSNVNNMRNMFFEALNFNRPLNNWDVSNVVDMSGMFFSASSFNQPLDNWDVSNVTNFDTTANIFKGTLENAASFNQDISNWNFNVSVLENFIKNSAMDSENYDLLLQRFVQLNLQNGSLDAEGLEYCDVYTSQVLEDDLGWNIDNEMLADDCTINYISGKVSLDENNNGCDSNDDTLSQFTVNTNDGQNDLSVLTDDQGDYLVMVDQGNFDVAMLNLPDYFDASPISHNISFNDTYEFEDQKDFCITANQSVEDLSIEVFPLDDAIPGFESEYEIVVKNFGTQTQNNIQVGFSFNDTYQSFVSASQSANQNGNSLSFDIASLSPYATETINLTLLNVQPPNLNSGDVLSFDADVSPNTNDINPDDNTVNFDQTVVNSFDPNDKLVSQGEQIPDEKIDEYLDYKIRFQNVGTANALNVVVTDTISDKLDWTTFQPINSSHNYRLELVEQEEINFIFENINLPYEAIDEPGSNGHVSFKIKPKDNVQIGDIIENKAYIFFDFNAPIITNTVSTEIVDEHSTTSFVQPENIKLSPNPAENQVEIINESNATIQSLQLYTIKGQLINTFTDKSQINVSQLNSGVYILQVETRNNKINKRLIKR